MTNLDPTPTETTFTETASTRYSDTLEKFKLRLSQNPGASLREFCHEVHVNYDGMKSWYSHHDISMRNLRKEAKKRLALPEDKPMAFVPICPKASSKDSMANAARDKLHKIKITFPGGIDLALQESEIDNVVSLLLEYRRRQGGTVPCSD